MTRFFIMMPTTFTVVVVLISFLLLTGSTKAQNTLRRPYYYDDKTPLEVDVGAESHYGPMGRWVGTIKKRRNFQTVTKKVIWIGLRSIRM
jgi:hypothetical protein